MATSPATTGRTRLTARGRFLLGASGLIVALSVISANTALGSNESSSSVSMGAGYQSITVLPGESLWSIARQIAPEFSMSTGDVVALIIEINNLPSAELKSGAELLIPTR